MYSKCNEIKKNMNIKTQATGQQKSDPVTQIVLMLLLSWLETLENGHHRQYTLGFIENKNASTVIHMAPKPVQKVKPSCERRLSAAI